MSTEMQTEGKRRGRKPRAPVDMSERVIDLKAWRDSIPELEKLCRDKIDASKDFIDACKAVGEKSNIHQSNIARYILASVRDKLQEHKVIVTQMQLLLEDGAPDGQAIN